MTTSARKVAVLVGSIRKDATSRKVANALIGLAPASLALEIVEISDLLVYNQDLESTAPAVWKKFRDRIRTVDAVLFVTPEHNRSVPAALKNAVDVGSRPFGHGVWSGKSGAVVSVSPSTLGAFGANHHLRQSLVYVNVSVMPQPEAYIGGAASLFDEQGRLANEDTSKFFAHFMQAFEVWIEAQAN